MKIKIDMAAITLGEMEDFEDAAGVPLSALSKLQAAGDLPTKFITALVWLALKHDDPKLTLDDVRKMKFTDLEFDIEDTSNPPAESD